jgi:hypothetical protein
MRGDYPQAIAGFAPMTLENAAKQALGIKW